MRRRWLSLLLPLLFTGCFNGFVIRPTNVDCPIEETVIIDPQRWLCRNKVAIIDVEGMILNAKTGGWLTSGDNPLALFRERLDAAATDKRVKAIVLRINSP